MQDIVQLLAQHGLALIFANVLLDQLGVPVPAIPTLMVAGAFAAAGRLPATEALRRRCSGDAACGLRMVPRGQALRQRGDEALCRVSLTPDLCVNQTHTLFERWGVNALLIAKFIPGLSVIAPPLAGATGVGWRRFLMYSAAGAGLWVGAGMGAGLVLKDGIEYLLGVLESTGFAALSSLGAAFAAYVAYKWWERHRFFAMLRMARIDVHELYRLMGAGAVPIVVDVRSQSARRTAPKRIPGARHVPLARSTSTRRACRATAKSSFTALAPMKCPRPRRPSC